MRGTSERELLAVADVATRLSVGERFVRRLVEERRIPYFKVGRYVRFDASEVEAWIEEQRVSSVRL